MKWFLKRLAEPSSQAGVASVIGTAAAMAAGTMPLTAGAVALVTGLLAFLVPERTNG